MTSDLKCPQIEDSEQGQFKVVRENSGYGVQCTLPIYLPFSKIFQNLWSHAIGRSPLNLSNLSLCPFIWNSHLFCLQNSSVFDGNTWSKNSQKIQNFFTSLKSVNNKHTLFELMSRWNIHQHPPRERLRSGRETWLSVMEKASALGKMQSQSKDTKKNKKSSLSRKPEKAA